MHFLVTCPALSLQNGEVDYNSSKVFEGYPVETVASFTCRMMDSCYLDQIQQLVKYQDFGIWKHQYATRSNEKIVQFHTCISITRLLILSRIFCTLSYFSFYCICRQGEGVVAIRMYFSWMLTAWMVFHESVILWNIVFWGYLECLIYIVFHESYCGAFISVKKQILCNAVEQNEIHLFYSSMSSPQPSKWWSWLRFISSVWRIPCRYCGFLCM